MKESFIDVHCHLDAMEDQESIVKRAIKKEVRIVVAQGTNPESNRKVLNLTNIYKEVKAALGIYPINALEMEDKEINEELKFIEKNQDKLSAIGEVGIDFKEDEKNHERQKGIFRKFVRLSIKLNKPIIIHSRKAEKECIEILEEEKAKKVVMHCFCGKYSLVERIVKNGWFLTVPTNVKNSQQFQDIAKKIPLENLFCETDSPYLHPKREWPNEPANVIVSYEKIAQLKGMKISEVKKKIFENYQKLFL